MRRAGVWSSARSSALRTIGEALHRASSTSGGNGRVGRQRPGKKGGISGPAATGLTFPTTQGRNALPAPSAAAAQPRAAAPIKGGACETAPVEGGFAAERLIERGGRARLVFGVCDDACLIDFPQRRDTAANRRQATLDARTGTLCRRPVPTIRAGDPRMGWHARRARPKPPEFDCDDHDCDDDEDCRADMRCKAAKGAAARLPSRPGRPRRRPRTAPRRRRTQRSLRPPQGAGPGGGH